MTFFNRKKNRLRLVRFLKSTVKGMDLEFHAILAIMNIEKGYLKN